MSELSEPLPIQWIWWPVTIASLTGKHARRSAFQSKALSELVAVAEHTLPKTKREAVQREYKQAQVELHRSLKKGALLPLESRDVCFPGFTEWLSQTAVCSCKKQGGSRACSC